MRLHHPEQPNSLSYVVEVIYTLHDGSTKSLDVQYSIPAFLTSRLTPNDRRRPKEAVPLQDALILPPKDVCDILVQAFFQIMHPAYPVFNRVKFTQLYLNGEASPLVLHAIFLLAYTVGNDELLKLVGCSDRASARAMHYARAKALNDSDYDNNSINTVACLFLLGFWWAEYDEQKDTCYWVGCATVLAQNLGMHRLVLGCTSVSLNADID